MKPAVLVIGGSGNIGRPVVDHFVEKLSKFSKVGILTTSPSKFAQQQAQGIQIVEGWFLDPAAYKGYDTVISLVGNSLMRLQPAMIEAAVAGGVTHFYPSELGSDVGQDALKDFRYFRDKRVTQDHLVAVAKQNPAFRYTLLITGPFTEWVATSAYGIDRDAKVVNAYGRGDAKLDVTSIPDVARYTVESVLIPTDPSQQKREIRVAGERTTFQNLIDVLGEVEGSKYTCNFMPIAEAQAEEDTARQAENEEQVLHWSLRTLGGGGNALIGGSPNNDKFGFTPESVRETFQRVYAPAL